MAVQSVCRNCKADFVIGDWDLAFQEKISVPPPTFCPECRQQRRTAQVNQIHLFKRKCDGTGASIISNYPPESPYKVYSQPYWWSDNYDGTAFGRDVDFSRPFFEQFGELSRVVPRPALFTDYTRDENSDYTNYAGLNKNCYMLFDSDENWDCYYSFGMNGSRSSFECYRVQKLELCGYCSDCTNCYNCFYAANSENCFDCALISNCIGCRSCIMCSNLRQKEYYYRNEKVSPETFAEIRRSLSSRKVLDSMLAEFSEFRLRYPQKFMRGYQNENVSGNYLVNSKNAIHCWDSMNLWDCKYCSQVFMSLRDSLDCHECGDSQLLYECNHLGYNGYGLMFSLQCLSQLSNLCYCDYCFNGCSDLFGCVGLKKKQYCILNKHYPKQDYEALRARLVEHMKQTGEWGEYFPLTLSAFPYNLTVAQEQFPLSRKEALAQGLNWYDYPARDYAEQSYRLAEDISQVQDDVLGQILGCSSCKRNYKIITQELAMYRKAGIPLPARCFYCRHQERLMARNPRQLWDRTCARCGTGVQTSYAPARPEIVCCESCYLDSLD